MLDVGQYLAAIGYQGPLDPSLETLRGLHECHVRAVPYHSRPDDAEFLTGAEFDVDKAFQHSIADRAGGSCYELNEPFLQLLGQLGFTAHRLSASTRLPSGGFGPEIEHLAVLVDLDGEQWLADVGYSEPTSFGPLRVTTEVQRQDGFQFRMVRDGEWWLLERLSPVKGWSGLYRFKAVARSLAAFGASLSEIAAQLSEWPAGNLRILSRVVGNSTVLMTGRRFMTYEAGREASRMVIDQDEYEKITDLILDPELTDAERAERIREFQS